MSSKVASASCCLDCSVSGLPYYVGEVVARGWAGGESVGFVGSALCPDVLEVSECEFGSYDCML